jgi:carboxyl-terminal processing protease
MREQLPTLTAAVSQPPRAAPASPGLDKPAGGAITGATQLTEQGRDVNGGGAALAAWARPGHGAVDRPGWAVRVPVAACVGLGLLLLLLLTRPAAGPEVADRVGRAGGNGPSVDGRLGAPPPSHRMHLVPEPVRLPRPPTDTGRSTSAVPDAPRQRAAEPAKAVPLPRPPTGGALPPVVATTPVAPPGGDEPAGSGRRHARLHAVAAESRALAVGLLVGAVGLVGAGRVAATRRSPTRRVPRRLPAVGRAALACLAPVALTACGGGSAAAPRPAQPPSEYLENALGWMQEHAVARDRVDWTAVRRDALALAPQPRTTAETYPALRSALAQLGDAAAFMLEPGEIDELTGLGVTALYPHGTVVFVEPDSPAALAGVREGDVIEQIDGEAPRPHGAGPPGSYPGTWFADTGKAAASRLVLRRPGQDRPTALTVARTSARYEGSPLGRRIDAPRADVGPVGYLELPWDWGSPRYPTSAQQAMRAADSAAACGWVVDLRRNIGGDLWSYLAAVGPLLGEGDLGGFALPDGTSERWSYRAGKVLWDGRERDESYLEGPLYSPRRPAPPVAVLTSRATFAAGELVRIAFEGRPATRSFGEPTGGRPVLLLHTPLSDGAHLAFSGAYAFDRTGRTHDRPIPPDQTVETDWTLFGTPRDPVLRAAVEWLHGQPDCAR